MVAALGPLHRWPAQGPPAPPAPFRAAWKQAHPETLALINDVEGLIGAGGQSLTFRMQDGPLTDAEAGSAWDPVRGLAKSVPLAGEGLQPIPSLSSCDWAWSDFYPDSTFLIP